MPHCHALYFQKKCKLFLVDIFNDAERQVQGATSRYDFAKRQLLKLLSSEDCQKTRSYSSARRDGD